MITRTLERIVTQLKKNTFFELLPSKIAEFHPLYLKKKIFYDVLPHKIFVFPGRNNDTSQTEIRFTIKHR